MSFLGDIVGGIGDALGAVVNTVSDIANSTVGQLALDIAGSFAGDPQLGAQVAQYAGAAQKVLRLLGVGGKVPTKHLAATALTLAKLHRAGITPSHYVNPRTGAGFLLLSKGGRVVGGKALGMDPRWRAQRDLTARLAAQAAAAQRQQDFDLGLIPVLNKPRAPGAAPLPVAQEPDPTFPPPDNSGTRRPVHVVEP